MGYRKRGTMIQVLPHKIDDLISLNAKIKEIKIFVDIVEAEESLFASTSIEGEKLKMLYNAALDLWNACIRNHPSLEQDYIIYKELMDCLKPKEEIDLSRFPKNFGYTVNTPKALIGLFND